MKNAASLSLIICLVLQLAPLRTVGGISTALLANSISSITEFSDVATYHFQHKKELLKIRTPAAERESAVASTVQLSHFVHHHTAELLPKKWRSKSQRIAQVIMEEAQRHQIDPLLIMSVVHQESTFRPEVVGRHGEIGLMQMRPVTAKWMINKGMIEAPKEKNIKKALRNPTTNLRFGVAYLAYLRSHFGGKARLFLSAYNMGEGNLRNLLSRGERPAEYVGRILVHYKRFSRGFEKYELPSESPTHQQLAAVDPT